MIGTDHRQMAKPQARPRLCAERARRVAIADRLYEWVERMQTAFRLNRFDPVWIATSHLAAAAEQGEGRAVGRRLADVERHLFAPCPDARVETGGPLRRSNFGLTAKRKWGFEGSERTSTEAPLSWDRAILRRSWQKLRLS